MPYIPAPPSNRFQRIIDEPDVYFAEARGRAAKELEEQRKWERRNNHMKLSCRFGWHKWGTWKPHTWLAVNDITYVGQATNCLHCNQEKIRTIGP